MRPALKTGLLPVWRDRETLQIGVDPRRAVALRLGPAAAVISLLDGSRDQAAVIATAAAGGVPAAAAQHVLKLLATAGLLDDFPARLHRSMSAGLRARLAPDLAAASLGYRDSDAGARTLIRRRDAFVQVYGCGRIGAGVAAALAASGVGRIACTDPAPARPADLLPGGLLAGDVGSARADGAIRAVRRAAPEATIADGSMQPDLAVLTAAAPPDLAARLTQAGVPHLVLRAAEAIGVAGPLVLPGRSACLRCVDLRKADADPAWPMVLAQACCALDVVPACDVPLALGVAALGCAQALLFLDGVVRPATLNGTLELVLPDWQWRRRTWPPHPACRCSAQVMCTGGARDAGQ